MEIKQSLVDESKYNIKCPYEMTPEFIVVHNTANDAPAQNEIAYMKRNNNTTSFHIAVDDIEAIQGIPFNRNAWHAGDGRNGVGNRKGIAIEICWSKSGGERWEKAKENAIELIVQLLKERNWGIDKVKKHQDFMNKYCPHRLLDEGWDLFLNKICERLGQEPIKKAESEITYTLIKKGSKGNLVKMAQDKLIAKGYNLSKYGADASFGNETELAVKQLQKDAGIAIDGIVGKDTWAVLNSDFIKPNKPSYQGYLIKKGQKSENVKKVQARLIELGYSCGKYGADSNFGNDTENAVKAFQRDNGLAQDGIVGPKTWEKLY